VALLFLQECLDLLHPAWLRVAAFSYALPSEESKLGDAPLRFSRVRVFGPTTQFISPIESDQPPERAEEGYAGKTRTLENRKGAAPATHNLIPFQIFHPIP
jgi:hypothetical protein